MPHCDEFNRIKSKYPNKIPIKITCIAPLVLTKTKYLMDGNQQISDLLLYLRSKCSNVQASESILVFTKSKKILIGNTTIRNIDPSDYNEDGFLYLEVCKESTFGHSLSFSAKNTRSFK